MPRQARIDIEGGLYHVFNRGIRKENIFRDDSDYSFFLDSLSKTYSKYSFDLYAYALMPNHFHLLIERASDPLSLVMKSISVRYAAYFNRKYSRTGHLFQGRFSSILCSKETYLIKLIKYIHLNPVRAGFVEKPSEWKWSSYDDYLGKRKNTLVNTDAFFDLISLSGRRGEFSNIMKGISILNEEELYPAGSLPVLGDAEFKKSVLKRKRYRRKTLESERLPLSKLAVRIAEEFDISTADLKIKKGSKKITEARSFFCYIASRYCGHTNVNIAKYIKKDYSTVSHALTRISKNKTPDEIQAVADLVLN
ncbi:MAG: hypothetical protein GX817_07235 [Elusimicrobia bacterium]|nr:hypothetical protein [Elusimicrobiota bacterium]